MIYTDLSIEQRIAEANTVIISRPVSNDAEIPVLFKNGNSAVITDFPNIRFEEWLENPTLTFAKSSNGDAKSKTEDIFVSPVKSSIKVKMKVRIGSKVPPIPIDQEDIVFLDE